MKVMSYWGGGGAVVVAEGGSECLILNGTQYYNSLTLVIRPKFGFSLQLYYDVVIKMKLCCLLFA